MSPDKLPRRDFLRRGLQSTAAAAALTSAGGCGLLLDVDDGAIIPHPSWAAPPARGAGLSAPDAARPPAPTLRVVSYNCHMWTGSDGRVDAWRTADVLAALAPDIVTLQEVTRARDRDTGLRCAEIVATRLGLDLLMDPRPTAQRDQFLHLHGNALLTRFPLLKLKLYDLSVADRRRRAAFDATLLAHERRIRIVGTHFGLKRRERRAQTVALLEQVVARPLEDACIVTGDFNIWWRGSASLRLLTRYLGPSRGSNTYPARRPTMQLDRIFVAPHAALSRIGVDDSRLARRASDHLPIWADITL